MGNRNAEQQRAYRAKNIDRLRAYAREYWRRRYRSDPEWRERRLRHSSKAKSTEKGRRTVAEYRKGDGYQRSRLKYLLRKQYGISLEDYEALLKRQHGLCGLCGEPPKGKRRLAVDHCHDTNRIRGLLCHSCNLWLGQVERYLRAPGIVDAWLLVGPKKPRPA